MGRLSARTAPEPFASRTSRRVNRFLSEEPVSGTINDAFAAAQRREQRREQRIFCTTLSLVEKPSPRRCPLPVVSVGSPPFRAEHHGTERFGFLARPQQSVGNQADDSRWQNNLPRTMEDFVEVLDDSDCSNLSTTQENDPDAYEGLQQLQGCDSLSMSSGSRQPDKPVPDTGKSYTDNDTGHIKLDFSPQPLFSQAPGDEIGNGQLPTKSGMVDLPQEDSGIPRTPAQPRFVPKRPGTLLRASQMFRETQPSPASCGRQGIGSSSDRPTPGLYNNLRLQSYELSPLVSPLNRHSEKVQPAHLTTVEASSPLQPSKSSIVNKSYPQPSQILPRVQHRASLYDTYESRKESQERRMRLAGAIDGSQSSDDAFSDSDAEISRRARRAKEAAAREIAVASVSIPHPNPKNDEVEVPSTNRRRRSRSESCTSQGSGEVSRSAQENTTIVDSQVVPAVIVVEEDCCLALESNEPAAYSPNSARDDASSSPPKHSTRPNTLPRFRQDDFEAMENGPEVCDTSARRLVRQLSTETCNKGSYVYSPAEYKVRSPQDRIGLVPETSPLGPHQYGLAICDSNGAPEIAVEDLAEIEIHPAKNDAFDEATKSPALRPRSQRQIFALPEQGPNPSKAESGSNEMLQLRHSPVNSISTTKESPPTAKAQNMTSTSPVLEEISDGKIALKSIPSLASSLSAKMAQTKDRTQEITDGNLPETGAGHKRMRSASKLRSPLKSLRRAVGEGENIANKTVVEDTASFCSEVRADIDSRSDPAATNRLENPSEGHILSLEMIGGSNTATVAGGSSGITSSSDAVTRTHEQSQKNLKLSKGIRNTSETSRRLTRKNRAQSNRTPNNALLTSSTYKPVTRSSRQTSVTSEKSKTAELEDRDVPTIWGRKKSLSSRSTTGDLDIFRNMAFSVSYIKRVDEKKRVMKLIKQHGGQLLENGFDELFDFSSEVTTLATSPERNDSRPINLALTAGSRNIGFVCLIADEHSRKAKYMQALALDLPCISGKWIEHCVTKGQILDWDSYLLAAGESSFLGGAVHNRNLKPYSALTSKFARHFEERKKLLEKKSVLLIMGKGRAEERKRAYLFLTRALGADRVERVHNNQEARKVLLASETRGELWGLVYVDEKEEVAEEAIFGAGPPRKRKRSSLDVNDSDFPVPKKVRIISDEFVIQSLILGKLLEEGG